MVLPTDHAQPPPENPASGCWIACLCAAWCGTCRDWQPVLEPWAATQPGLKLLWVDIEDEADWLDPLDLEIDTFPTLLLARQDRALFLGPVVPQLASVNRLLERLGAAPPADTVQLAPAHALAAQLWQRHGPAISGEIPPE